MNTLTTLENEIYNSIPRLRELSSGCVIQSKSTKIKFTIIGETSTIYYAFNEIYHSVSFSHNEIIANYETIGHPILLNDVLEWMNFIRGKNIIENTEKILRLIANWNLPKPKLSDQSQELIDALTELIPK